MQESSASGDDPFTKPDDLLGERVRRALWLLLGGSVCYSTVGVLEVHGRLPLVHVLQAIPIAAAAVLLLALGRTPTAQRAVTVALVALGAVATSSGLSGVVAGNADVSPLLLSSLAIGGAALFPWGAAAQTAAATIAGIGIFTNIIFVPGSGGFGYLPRLTVLVVLAASVWVSRELDRWRTAITDDAEVTASLARIGQDLISAINTSELLDRLCRLTNESLGCERSYTMLWKPDEDVYIPAAQHGDTSENWESFRLLKIPAEVASSLLDALARQSVFWVDGAALRTLPLAQLATDAGVTRIVYIALHRGDRLVGVLTAVYASTPLLPFGPKLQRIARGIGQLGSFGIQNAQLVEELERASKVKSEFVATMSHELRTPLSVMIGYNSLLLEGAFGPLQGAQADAVARVGVNAYELLGLINSLLDLSRLDAGRVQLKLEETDFGELLREIEAEINGIPRNPAVALEWRIPAGITALWTDARKVKIIAKNLIHNALKFTSEGRVSVELSRKDGGAAIAVCDTGIGIAEAAQNDIFEAFKQADNGRGLRAGGVGLGLYIVRRLLDLVGGTIDLDSQVGRGSTFTVWIPDRRTDAPAEPPSSAVIASIGSPPA